MPFASATLNLDSIYNHESRLTIIEELYPMLSKGLQSAVNVLRYCRIQLIHAGMRDVQIPVFSISSVLLSAGIPDDICTSVESALSPYLHDLEYIDFEFLERMELIIIRRDALFHMKR